MRILAIVPFILLLGCSSSPPERHLYLLRGACRYCNISETSYAD